MEGTREMVARANYIVVDTEDAVAVRILRVMHAAQLWPFANNEQGGVTFAK